MLDFPEASCSQKMRFDLCGTTCCGKWLSDAQFAPWATDKPSKGKKNNRLFRSYTSTKNVTSVFVSWDCKTVKAAQSIPLCQSTAETHSVHSVLSGSVNLIKAMSGATSEMTVFSLTGLFLHVAAHRLQRAKTLDVQQLLMPVKLGGFSHSLC